MKARAGSALDVGIAAALAASFLPARLEAATLASGRVTYYFRHTLNVQSAAAIGWATIDLLYDDGAVIYLNGTEVYRTSLLPPSGEVAYNQTTSPFVADNTIDLVLPVLFLLPRVRLVALGYAAAWGLITALSRIASHWTPPEDFCWMHP